MDPEKEKNEQLMAARLTIKRYLHDINFEVMSNERGPLMIAELDPHVRLSSKMHDVMRHVGWPNTTDASMPKPPQFASDNDFLQVLRPHDEYGPRHIASSHFFQMLRVMPEVPESLYKKTGSVYEMYGLYPVMHRAYAVAPEFFDSLRVVVDDIAQRNEGIREDDNVYQELLQEKNAEIIAAMHAAFQLMARLIKASDSERIHELLAEYSGESQQVPTRVASPVVIPEDFLLRGDIGSMSL